MRLSFVDMTFNVGSASGNGRTEVVLDLVRFVATPVGTFEVLVPVVYLVAAF